MWVWSTQPFSCCNVAFYNISQLFGLYGFHVSEPVKIKSRGEPSVVLERTSDRFFSMYPFWGFSWVLAINLKWPAGTSVSLTWLHFWDTFAPIWGKVVGLTCLHWSSIFFSKFSKSHSLWNAAMSCVATWGSLTLNIFGVSSACFLVYLAAGLAE